MRIELVYPATGDMRAMQELVRLGLISVAVQLLVNLFVQVGNIDSNLSWAKFQKKLISLSTPWWCKCLVLRL